MSVSLFLYFIYSHKFQLNSLVEGFYIEEKQKNKLINSAKVNPKLLFIKKFFPFLIRLGLIKKIF